MGAAACSSLRAQSSSNDPGAPNMSGVTDVTPGWKYLLQNDDLVMLQVNTDANGTGTSLLSMNTSNSALSGTQQTISVATSKLPSSVDTQNSVLASEAAGRMFNTNTDAVGILYVYGSEWAFSVSNSAGVQAAAKLDSSFTPNGTVFTQVVMGDFKGDGLVEPLAFYENTNPPGTEVQWGMMVLPPYDPTVPWNFKEGPELSATTLPTPVAGTLVVGDFNGDGRSEIAALLNDYQTVAFYSVDPKTFAIAPITTVKLSANIPTIGNFPRKDEIPARWRWPPENSVNVEATEAPARRTVSPTPMLSSSGRSTRSAATPQPLDTASSPSKSLQPPAELSPSPRLWCR